MVRGRRSDVPVGGILTREGACGDRKGGKDVSTVDVDVDLDVYLDVDIAVAIA